MNQICKVRTLSYTLWHVDFIFKKLILVLGGRYENNMLKNKIKPDNTKIC
jgi:hypothetical protein